MKSEISCNSIAGHVAILNSQITISSGQGLGSKTLRRLRVTKKTIHNEKIKPGHG